VSAHTSGRILHSYQTEARKIKEIITGGIKRTLTGNSDFIKFLIQKEMESFIVFNLINLVSSSTA
jgi:hypothetical protein